MNLSDFFDSATIGHGNEQAMSDLGITVQKIAHVVPMSAELAMDYGVIPDTRPAPPPPNRRERFRWWRQARVGRLRMRLASWIAGFDVEDRW